MSGDLLEEAFKEPNGDFDPVRHKGKKAGEKMKQVQVGRWVDGKFRIFASHDFLKKPNTE